MEFDLDKFTQDYMEANPQDQEPSDQVIEEMDDLVEDQEELEILPELNATPGGFEEDEVVEEQQEEIPAEVNSPEEQKRNQAFANMRRELEESKRLSDWINTVAQQNGITPEQMMENY